MNEWEIANKLIRKENPKSAPIDYNHFKLYYISSLMSAKRKEERDRTCRKK